MSKEHSHTPRPWERDATGKYYAATIIRHNGVLICNMIHQPTMTTDELEANIALVIAAPDLLKACKGLIALVESFTPFQRDHGSVQAARAAIAKATAQPNPES